MNLLTVTAFLERAVAVTSVKYSSRAVVPSHRFNYFLVENWLLDMLSASWAVISGKCECG